MLRLSRLSDYAVVVLVRLGRNDAVTTSTSLASGTGIPEPTVAKLLKLLAGAGLVRSQRGARGGYRINRALEQIAITEVVEAVDGKVSLVSCVDGADGACQSEERCPIRGCWDPVNEAIRFALNQVTLAQIATVAGRHAPAHVPSGQAITADRTLS